jgi:hypothetical protein
MEIQEILKDAASKINKFKESIDSKQSQAKLKLIVESIPCNQF